MLPSISLAALWLAVAVPALASKAGTIEEAGETLVSAMMMFLGNTEKVYIIDKAEGNAAQVNGHPAWGAVWDIASRTAEVMDIRTNVFCASGMHLPNGSFATFGGNGAITKGGNIGSVPNNEGSASFDDLYQDYDGGRSIRVLNPCTSSDNFDDPSCQWFDNPDVLAMQRRRWYSASEPLGDGTIVLIGGFVNGGYINRNYPNTDPEKEGGAADCTYEYYPDPGKEPQTMDFMIKTSGLNSYAHTYLMASGNMLVQANYSTVLWDHETNTETELPDMPGQIIRVYPASGAVAMLPMTPANNYSQTVLFCGGSDLPDESWGNYSWPFVNTWEFPASKDCQRLEPEPQDGSTPAYEQDDDMLEGRTMGQFIVLPTGKLLVVNGGTNGTAGFSTQTLLAADLNEMPFDQSLASGPVGTPAIYDPEAPKGSRWSNAGFQTSNIARLYHSSAMLLPDGAVMIAGSNPNLDVNLTATYPTQYAAEYFYPDYFSATTRPEPSGLPTSLSYGGDYFDVTVPASSYSGAANDAADNTKVTLVRPGWTTHAMNMGQRFLQLNNTYSVEDDGSITLHVSQLPPNPNLFQPGPALINGTMIIVGTGNIETQPTAAQAALPDPKRLDSASGTADGSTTGSTDGSDSDSGTSTGAIVGGVVAGIAVLGILGAIIGICISRRRRAAARDAPQSGYPMTMTPNAGGTRGAAMRNSDSSAFMPLQHDNQSRAWGTSQDNLAGPYRDNDFGRESGNGMSMEYDPYSSQARMSSNSPRPGQQRAY
ncbi:copper radical oxidase variant A [Schizophyllum amplum]|uniref:Copper radical oxidase variant A n=1 Tax=Schizophyllum amplum TaxID=97359 RepID=A0A550BXV9_9AGAR|nr:copper radical oxidase variant A [Auriculariopsis ampla]